MSNESKVKDSKTAGGQRTAVAAKGGNSPRNPGGAGPAGPGNDSLPRSKAPPRLQDTFVDERNDVLTVINELEDQLDRHTEIRESLERELTNTSERLQAASQRTQELEWNVVTLQTRVDALEQVKQEVAALEEEVADANGRSQRLSEQLNVIDKERHRLKNELKAANKQLDELWAVRKERDGLRVDCKTLSGKVDELERFQRDIIEDRTQLQAQLQELQISVDELRAERSQLDHDRRIAEERVRELTQIEDALSDKIDNLRAEKKSLQVQLAHLERENSRLIEQRQFYESEVTSLRNQNRTAEAALAGVKKAFTEVRIALTETKSRARRHALDSWPRIGTTLAGVDERQQAAEEASMAADDPLGARDEEEVPTLDESAMGAAQAGSGEPAAQG